MNDILTGFDYSPPPASRLKRWVACFIDYVIYFTLIGFSASIWGDRHVNIDGSVSWELNGLPGFLAIVIPWLFFFPAIESFNSGQTIGKALFRIKTVHDDFFKVSFGSSFVKHMFDLIDFLPLFGILGLLVTTNNKYRQRIGDLVAKTVVIDANYTPPAQNTY
ncbi:RDD family protein [Niastella sp. OAS944]|uniref:RDD family protein n=1 Tax=Niastella sp. OAS944 TaxID=2664089 RepID=UPI00346B56F1|nr:putative RDD family membrane protein YckC [Chitinophagaceae bacterium OAS944]